MLRPATAALCAATLLALGASTAAAQQTAPPPATTAPAAPTPPPALDSLRLPRTITAQQGHARFLVGVRLSAPAKLTVQVLSGATSQVVQTLTDAAARPAGRNYLILQGVDTSGFQLLQGAYRVRIQATDDQGRVSAPLQGAFTLKLTPPRGLLDAYTIPLWRAFRRQAGTTAKGQLVAVVAPKGAAATAGIRRGDVITSINGHSVATGGEMTAVLRALPAGTAVAIEMVRAGRPLSASMQPKPDWTAAPDYATPLRVAVRRDPRTIAYAVAQARQMIEAGKTSEARARIAAWPQSWRISAPGELTQGDLLAKGRKWTQALGAYSRARARDRGMSAAELGRGIALSETGKTAPSIVAFTAGTGLDPGDPVAAGFLSYALLREGRATDAVAAGQAAVRLDPFYADGYLPLGIALIAAGDRANGVKALRRGLVLLEDAGRANRLARAHLDPTDP